MLLSEEEILDKYDNLIKLCVSKYTDHNNYDDLYQEALLSLILAYRSYRDTHNCTFITWAYICINNRLKNIMSRKIPNIDIYSYTKEFINIEDILPVTLTDMEKEIVYLRLYSYTFAEIASFYALKIHQIKYKYKSAINKIRIANQ